MSGRRKNVMDIRELLRHMRNTPSDRGVQRATGVDRRTVKQHRKWAQELRLPAIQYLGTQLVLAAGFRQVDLGLSVPS